MSPRRRRLKTQRRTDHHGEDEHRRTARRVQGDDAPRAVRLREAVRRDLRREGRGPGRGGPGRRPRWRRPGGRGRGEGRVRRHPGGGGRQEDPGHQGSPVADQPRPQGGQGPGGRRAAAGTRAGEQGSPPTRPRQPWRAPARRSPSSSASGGLRAAGRVPGQLRAGRAPVTAPVSPARAPSASCEPGGRLPRGTGTFTHEGRTPHQALDVAFVTSNRWPCQAFWT